MYDPGRYRVRITDAALGESESKATPQIEVHIAILHTYDASFAPVQCPNGQRTVYLALTDGTLGTMSDPGWVAKLLLALGWTGPSLASLEMLAGKEMDAQCEYDNYSGEDKEKWSLWGPRTGAKNPAKQSTVTALDRKFSWLLNQANKTPAAAAPAQRPAPRAPQHQSREDIPF